MKLMLAGPRLLAVYGRSRMDPVLRERVMVAVSRANACEGCTRVHEAWALRVGASVEELKQIGAGDLAQLSPQGRAAVVYATALAEARFDSVSPDAQAVADEQLGDILQRDVEAVARLMTFANLSVNSADAVLRKLR